MYGGDFAKKDESLCNGCLAAGRRLVEVADYWKREYFTQILSEVPPMQLDETSLRICWECNARLTAALNFKQQVKMCLCRLRDYAKTALTTTALPPRLVCSAVHIQSVPPDIPHDGSCRGDSVKTEEDWESNDKVDILKQELDQTASPDRHSFTLSDDEELKYLIDTVERGVATPKKKRDKTAEVSGEQKRTKRSKREGKKDKFKVIKISHEEMLEERMALEESVEFQSSKFKCGNCLVTFKDDETLQQHLKAKHSSEQGAHRCPTCDCAFRSDAALRCHAARHLRRYGCGACAARHASRRRAARHRLAHQQYACTCGRLFSKEGAYRSHMNTHKADEEPVAGDGVAFAEDQFAGGVIVDDAKESDGPKSLSSFPCELCSKVFRWKTSLRKHAELHRIQAGEKKTPYCDACRLPFTTTANLQKHVKTSSKHQIQLKLRNLKELLKDEPEERKLAPIEAIKTSVRNALNKFACPHCDNKFQWKGNLLRHIQSHKARANGELYCAPCDRKFSSLATYQQHMKISKKHVTENDFRYMCSDCGRKFANKTRLKDHVDWEHLKIYSHKCPLCEKVFKSNTSLYLHKQVVHRKENGDHLCDHCGKPFPNRAKLRGHITAMHTSEQPYKCKLCAATFSWHSCLSRHVKVVHHKIKTKRKRKTKADFPPTHLPLAPSVIGT